MVCRNISLYNLLFLLEIVCGFIVWFWCFFLTDTDFRFGGLAVWRHWGFLVICGSCPCISFIAESEDLTWVPLIKCYIPPFSRKRSSCEPLFSIFRIPILSIYVNQFVKTGFSLRHVTCLESSVSFVMGFLSSVNLHLAAD